MLAGNGLQIHCFTSSAKRPCTDIAVSRHQMQPTSKIRTISGIILKGAPGNIAKNRRGFLVAHGQGKHVPAWPYVCQKKKEVGIYDANHCVSTNRTIAPSILKLLQLFHRLHALQVGTVPFTRNTYKPWTFIFGNSADPLLALRRTLTGLKTGHSNGMEKSCTLGTNEQHILLASRRFRVGPEFVVLHIGHSSMDTKNFALATRGAKAAWEAQTPLGEQIGDVLSSPRIGSFGGSSTKL